jgi:Fe-S cluster assembly protein SufD
LAGLAAVLPDSLRLQLSLFRSPRLVFVDGLFDPVHSEVSPPIAVAGASIGSLADALTNARMISLLEDHLGTQADLENHAFVAWNTALFSDGACMIVPPRTVISDPIHVIFVATGLSHPQVVFPRNLIIAGEASQLSVIETFLALSDRVYLTDAVTEIAAGPASVVDYYQIVNESASAFHLSSVTAALARNAGLTTHVFSLGASLARNEIRIQLDGEGAQCTLNGLFLVDGNRLVDNQTEIDHRQPHTTSRELYKGILAGRGQGVFNGAIIVRKDAQKTDAVQHNKNLLLSERAQINTKPQLAIGADDVRCSHGASIGQLDDDGLFYLMARGLDARTARRLLVHGFAREILDRVRVADLGCHLDFLLDEWFENRLEAA